MQIVFIVGTGRCGSTLMHEILAKHADSGFLSRIEEQRPRLARLHVFANRIYRAEHRWPWRLVADEFIPTEAYTLIDRAVSPIYSRPYRDLTEDDVTPWLETRFRKLFESRHRANGLPVTVHKYTGWSRLGFFNRIFPEARFIHVVRDGRAVANSWLQMRWWDGYEGVSKWLWGPLTPERQERWAESGQMFPVLAALGWEQLLDSYTTGKANVAADRYREIRYEDLLARPNEVCREVLDFCGLAWTPDFEKQFATFDITTSRRNAYERDVTSVQLQAIERAIGPALCRAGYA